MTARIIPFPEHRIVREIYQRHQGDSPVAKLAALIHEAIKDAEAEARAKRRKKK